MNRDEILEVAYGDHPDYKTVTDAEIYDQSRWSVYKSMTVKNLKTEEFFTVWWGEGATEYQEDQDEPCGMYEVTPVEVTVIKYIKKKEGYSVDA